MGQSWEWEINKIVFIGVQMEFIKCLRKETILYYYYDHPYALALSPLQAAYNKRASKLFTSYSLSVCHLLSFLVCSFSAHCSQW
jgi:hypothetical protein